MFPLRAPACAALLAAALALSAAATSRADIVLDFTLPTAPSVSAVFDGIDTDVTESWLAVNPQDFPSLAGQSGNLIITIRAPAGSQLVVPPLDFTFAEANWQTGKGPFGPGPPDRIDTYVFLGASGAVPSLMSGLERADAPVGSPGTFGDLETSTAWGANAAPFALGGVRLVSPFVDALVAAFPNSAGPAYLAVDLAFEYKLPGDQTGHLPAARTFLAPVPEPSSLVLMATAIAFAGVGRLVRVSVSRTRPENPPMRASRPAFRFSVPLFAVLLLAWGTPLFSQHEPTPTHRPSGAMPAQGGANGSLFGGASGIGAGSSRGFQQQMQGLPTQAGAHQSYSQQRQPQQNQQGYVPLNQFNQRQQQQQQQSQNVQAPTHRTQPPGMQGMTGAGQHAGQQQTSDVRSRTLPPPTPTHLQVQTGGKNATTGPGRGNQLPQNNMTGGANSARNNTTGGTTGPGRGAAANHVPQNNMTGTTGPGRPAPRNNPPQNNTLSSSGNAALTNSIGNGGATDPGRSAQGNRVPQNNTAGGNAIPSSNAIPGGQGRGGARQHVPQNNTAGGNATSSGGTTAPGRNAMPGRNNALGGTTDPGRPGRNALPGRGNMNTATTDPGRNALPGRNNAVSSATANGNNNRPGSASAGNALPGSGTTGPGRGGNAVSNATGNKLVGNAATTATGRGPRPISARHNARLGGSGGTRNNQGGAGTNSLPSSTATGRNDQHTVMRPKPSTDTGTPKAATGTTGTGRSGQNLTTGGGTTGNQGQGARSRVQGQSGGGLGQTTASANKGPKPGPAAAARLNPRFKRPALGSRVAGNAKKPGVKIPDGAGVGQTSNLAGAAPAGVVPLLPNTPSNQLNLAATNPTQGLSLVGNHSGADSANTLIGETIAAMHDYRLNEQGKTDLNTFKQDVQNGASSAQIKADYDRLNDDITASSKAAGYFPPALQQLQQQASQVASLSSIRDQLEQGPPPQDQPLPTGPATIINNPALPQGQMVALGDNTVLVGGGGLPIPQGATYIPIGGNAGGNVAMWTGTLADIGIPVQTGYPVPDVDLTAAVVPIGVASPVVAAPTDVPATVVPAVGGGPVATLPPGGVPVASLPPGGVPAPTPTPAAVVANSLPPAQVPPAPPAQLGTIVIVNPADSGGTVTYSLGGDTFSLEPGFEQDHQVDQSAVVAFDRGEQFGQAQYTLTPESYRFLVGDKGWDLQKLPHSITLDNSDNPNDFNFTMKGEAQVVPARQSKRITGEAKIRLAFDRGDGGDAAVKELVDGAYKIGVSPQTGLLDLFTDSAEPPADEGTQAPAE